MVCPTHSLSVCSIVTLLPAVPTLPSHTSHPLVSCVQPVGLFLALTLPPSIDDTFFSVSWLAHPVSPFGTTGPKGCEGKYETFGGSTASFDSCTDLTLYGCLALGYFLLPGCDSLVNQDSSSPPADAMAMATLSHSCCHLLLHCSPWIP